MKTIKKSKVKGLYYLSWKVGSYYYLTIMHDISNKPLVNFTSAPVEKITDVIKVSDEILSKSDWNIPESKLTNKNEDAIKNLKKRIIVNDPNKFVVKK